VIEEVEVWYILLLFAVLAFAAYSARDKLPFWQDRDENSPYNRRRRLKEAHLLHRAMRKLITKHDKRLTERGRSELTAALEGLGASLEGDDDARVRAAVRKLEDKSNRYLAFARKGARREYLESVGVAVLVAVVLRLFVIEAFKIPSESMVPTLMVGDHIFVSKYRYGLSIPFANKRLVRFLAPARGEVVVFVKPSFAEQTGGVSDTPVFDEEYEMVGKDFIKRIAALPGDLVELREDVLWVNGESVPRCRVGRQTYRTLNRLTGRWEDDEAELWIERNGEHLYTVIEETEGPLSNFGPARVPDDQVFVLGDNRDNSNDSRYWGSVPFDNIKGRAMFIRWSNRRPHGFQWDRVGNSIMSEPTLSPEQQAALARCPDMR
ncbi:MAG: signal peptidase I, partial [Deltaproteobacteria bacterium]|nr:signal peptidase I [Deltaproteobacteria bacterium]